MRTHLRTGVIAGVAVALVLTLPSTGTARSRPQPEAGRGMSHAQARAILDEARAALTRKPGTSRGTAAPVDLTMLLRDLRMAMPALSPSERATASSLIGLNIPPPKSTCTGGLFDKVLPSAHFCLHYSGGTTDQWAQTTSDTLENVWSKEVDGLHFRHPPYDGDQLFDVTLEEIGNQGYYGACAPAQSSAQSTSSCVLDDDFDPAEFGGAPAINSLKVTAAHEFFHAIQFGYDATEDTWLMEGSAVWAEEQVYPDINDYLQYLPYSAITHPRTPVDYKGITSTDLYFRYGAALFWKFLSEYFHSPGVVRRVWEYAQGDRYSLQAVTAALGELGVSFAGAFARFGVWNTEPPGSYGDRGLFPKPVWWRTGTVSRRHPDTGQHAVVLHHLTNAASLLQPAGRLPKRTKLRVRVDAPALARMPRATVQVRRRDGSVRVLGVRLDSAGNGSILVNFDPRVVGSVVVTLTNASTRMSSCWTDPRDRFSCAGQSADDGLSFAVRARLKLPR